MKKIILIGLSLFAFQAFAGTKTIGKNVDVLIVIDNSGSMQVIQENVIKSAKVFFEQFAKQPYINWKIGLISTDKADAPYLGFNTPFDWSMIDYRDPKSFDNAVEIFQHAVSSLGTSGDGSEYVFYNVKRVLDLNTDFLRPNSNLVVIMITDETEHSKTDFGIAYNAPEFLRTLTKSVDQNQNKKIRFYGALSRRDLKGCAANQADFETYSGSQYEAIIKLTNGFNVSACADDFGAELAKIGSDIVSLVK